MLNELCTSSSSFKPDSVTGYACLCDCHPSAAGRHRYSVMREHVLLIGCQCPETSFFHSYRKGSLRLLLFLFKKNKSKKLVHIREWNSAVSPIHMQPARLPLMPTNISQQLNRFLTEQPVSVITGPWLTAFSSQIQEFSIDMLFKSGLSSCWAGDWRCSFHCLNTASFLWLLACPWQKEACVCLCVRHTETVDFSLCVSHCLLVSLAHIQSCRETATRWEAGLYCQTRHDKATFYTLSMLSSGQCFLLAKWCSHSVFVLLIVCPPRCQQQKYPQLPVN